MKQFLKLDEIIEDAEYFSSSEDFFGNFREAFDLTRSQILKVETRQFYREPGNESYEALEAGNWDLALERLEDARSVDKPLYTNLNSRGIDFIRCRPIKFPMTNYLKWEFEVYEFNSKYCERIFCANLDAVYELFRDNITKDFMVFDARVGFIHDYDETGLNIGGWKVESLDAITEMQKMFIFFKSLCQPYKMFNHA